MFLFVCQSQVKVSLPGNSSTVTLPELTAPPSCDEESNTGLSVNVCPVSIFNKTSGLLLLSVSYTRTNPLSLNKTKECSNTCTKLKTHFLISYLFIYATNKSHVQISA